MPPQPVIVVGSGLAGLSAAYEAIKSGASVRMLDRAPRPGGNSIKASSGINGAGTRFQRAAGIPADELFYRDTVQSAGARFTPQSPAALVDRRGLIETLTTSSAAAVSWLVDEIGVDLGVVAPLGGHSVPRTHRGAGRTPPGADIVVRLLEKLAAFGDRFKLDRLAEVTSLLPLRTDDDHHHHHASVGGVRYVQDGQTHEIRGAVVFAAGGFAGDAHGLLAKHRPDLAGIPSTNDPRPGAHAILQQAGAALVDMDSVQIHPTGFVDPNDPGSPYKFLAAEALRGEGAILLDGVSGRRFVNEMQTRDHVSRAIMAALPSGGDDKYNGSSSIRQWNATILLDPGACRSMAGHLAFYLSKGLLKKVRVRDLDDANLVDAIDRYAAAVAAGEDSAFGRGAFGRWTLAAGEANRDQEVCLGKVTPVVHFTMGGAAFDRQARVLASDTGEPIEGLWAAGEITGGLHGDNRLGGSSLLECVVFGKVAGRGAAAWLNSQS